MNINESRLIEVVPSGPPFKNAWLQVLVAALCGTFLHTFMVGDCIEVCGRYLG